MSENPETAIEFRHVSCRAANAHLRLAACVKAQKLPRSAEGLTVLVTRLRARGYLSHWVSANDAQGWRSVNRIGIGEEEQFAGRLFSESGAGPIFAQLTFRQ